MVLKIVKVNLQISSKIILENINRNEQISPKRTSHFFEILQAEICPKIKVCAENESSVPTESESLV